MTSPPKLVEVDCPRCGDVYETYYRPSINLTLDEDWSEDELREATTGTCPRCEFVVGLAR